MTGGHDAPVGIADRLRILPQHLLPQHFLSRQLHAIMRWRCRPWKEAVIRWFIRHYDVEMDCALHADPSAYEHFNAFFTRPLRPDARRWSDTYGVVGCPVDGRVSRIGQLTGESMIQAKGRDYSLHDLLGGDRELVSELADGCYCTLYLSPRDYHRIHMPLDGRLRRMIYLPGRLYAVNPVTASVVTDLFAANERVVNVFSTEAGTMAVIMVGAIFVGSMETVWAGRITPPYGARAVVRDYADKPIELRRGEEMGRFNMGSTVILIFGPGRAHWSSALADGTPVRLGFDLGSVISDGADGAGIRADR